MYCTSQPASVSLGHIISLWNLSLRFVYIVLTKRSAVLNIKYMATKGQKTIKCIPNLLESLFPKYICKVHLMDLEILKCYKSSNHVSGDKRANKTN